MCHSRVLSLCFRSRGLWTSAGSAHWGLTRNSLPTPASTRLRLKAYQLTFESAPLVLACLWRASLRDPQIIDHHNCCMIFALHYSHCPLILALVPETAQTAAVQLNQCFYCTCSFLLGSEPLTNNVGEDPIVIVIVFIIILPPKWSHFSTFAHVQNPMTQKPKCGHAPVLRLNTEEWRSRRKWDFSKRKRVMAALVDDGVGTHVYPSNLTHLLTVTGSLWTR